MDAQDWPKDLLPLGALLAGELPWAHTSNPTPEGLCGPEAPTQRRTPHPGPAQSSTWTTCVLDVVKTVSKVIYSLPESRGSLDSRPGPCGLSPRPAGDLTDTPRSQAQGQPALRLGASPTTPLPTSSPIP